MLECRYDDGRTEEVTQGEAKMCYRRFHGLLSFLQDWRTGAFEISMAEYRKLPAPLIDYKRIFTQLLSKRRES